MAVQYKANAKTKIGGAGSGSVNNGDRGLIKIILMGYKILDTVLFHAIVDSVPGNHSPFPGKSLTSGPNSELVIN